MSKKILIVILFFVLFLAFQYVKAEELKPDYLVSDIQLSSNGSIISVFINNISSASYSGKFEYKIEGLDSFGNGIKSMSLLPETSKSFNISIRDLPYEPLMVGNYKIKITLDPDNKISEISKENNVFEKTIYIDPTKYAQLFKVTDIKTVSIFLGAATINFNTVNNASCKVLYGDSESLPLSEAAFESDNTFYWSQLSTSKPGTKYYYKVKCDAPYWDADTVHTFISADSNMNLIKISDIVTEYVSPSSIRVKWKTGKDATCFDKISYGTDKNNRNLKKEIEYKYGECVYSHEFVLDNLESGKTYYYTIYSFITNGSDIFAMENNLNYTISPKVTKPDLIISNIESRIEVGDLAINNLPQTKYVYRVYYKNAGGSSIDKSFKIKLSEKKYSLLKEEAITNLSDVNSGETKFIDILLTDSSTFYTEPTLLAEIDSENSIIEANEGNNVFEKRIDTVIYDWEILDLKLNNDINYANKDLLFKYKIKNNSKTKTYSEYRVDLFWDGKSIGTLRNWTPAQALQFGQEGTYEDKLEGSFVRGGEHELKLDLLINGSDNTENNIITKKVYIKDVAVGVKPSQDQNINRMNDNAKTLNDGKLEELLKEIRQLRSELREQAAELKYLKMFSGQMKNLNANMQTAMKAFITYGVDENTQKLGEGERAAVISSYEAAFDKLPTTEAELADAIKIANGRFPGITNGKAEQRAKDQFFKIYNRAPDMSNPNDAAAVKVMAYGLRQKAENRNMGSETKGIKTFKYIFGNNPKTTEEWNTMQAITYSGASKKTDSDKDGLADETEKKLGTDANKADSDGDGYKDGTEVLKGFDPLKK